MTTTVNPPDRWAPPRGRPSWGAGRITALVFGVLLVFVSAGLLVGGGLLHALDSGREDGYLTTHETDINTTGFALASDELGLEGLPGSWAIGDTRLRVTGADPTTDVFVGLARPDDAAAYLSDVEHSTVVDVDGATYEHHAGGPPVGNPADSDIWVAQGAGTGTQTISWPDHGRWTVVAMNSNGTAGVDVSADAQIEAPHLAQLANGLLVAGGVGGLLSGALLWTSVRRRPRRQ